MKSGDKLKGIASFVEFCRYLEGGGLYANAHWAPQTSLLLMPLDQFDLIGRVEALDRDMRELALRLSFEPPAAGHRAGPGATNADDDAVACEHYTDEARHRITKLYAQDFDLLDYPRHRPV
jgi:hypothetical protein